MQNLVTSIQTIANKELEEIITNHLNDLIKPQGSLGRLEEFALQYCLCRGNADAAINRMKVFTFAGDHGVTEERITPFPSEVTQQMVLNMAHDGAGVSVMCRKAGIDYSVVDIGVNGDFGDIPGLIRKKVGKGTKNFTKEAAMTEKECEKAFIVGYDLGKECNADLVGLGDMGIGNTSSSSALYSLLLGKDPAETTGIGTGSVGEYYERKKNAIASAVTLHEQEWDGSPFDALRRLGGFEIAGMTGLIFGCATTRIPVVIDGFIVSASALIAMRMNPQIKDYLFFSHVSNEKFHEEFLDHEGIRPIVSLDMRLGEGTGAVLAMQIITQAMECYNEMATFSAAGVSNKSE